MAGNQPAAVLFVEHPAVGQGKDLPQGGRLFRSGKAKGHDDRHIAGMFVVMPENFPDLFQDPCGIAQVAPGQQHGELVTAHRATQSVERSELRNRRAAVCNMLLPVSCPR